MSDTKVVVNARPNFEQQRSVVEDLNQQVSLVFPGSPASTKNELRVAIANMDRDKDGHIDNEDIVRFVHDYTETIKAKKRAQYIKYGAIFLGVVLLLGSVVTTALVYGVVRSNNRKIKNIYENQKEMKADGSVLVTEDTGEPMSVSESRPFEVTTVEADFAQASIRSPRRSASSRTCPRRDRSMSSRFMARRRRSPSTWRVSTSRATTASSIRQRYSPATGPR